MQKHSATYLSPIGRIVVRGTDSGVEAVYFSDESPLESQLMAPYRAAPYCVQEAVEQLHEYFCHQRETFSIQLDLQQGTPFQQKVWQSLNQIPWGQTRSYAQIAIEIGQPQAVRAVGTANGQNPFLIVLPCHRVIGSSGLLTGYAGGLLRKRWLLQHEQESVQLEVFNS